MSNLLRKSAALVAAAALASTLTACGDDTDEVTIGYINWDEAVAASHMWKLILEEEGYEVNLEELEPGLIFEGMANGDIDFFLDGWLPTTHASYMEKYGDQLETIGVWYDNASLSVAVPTYVEDVNSLEDLAGNADMFDGKIIGIEEGAGLTTATQEELIPGYGLDGVMNLITSSTPAMLSELDTAIANNEPIVVTLWHPHWAYAKYDLKDLEDPLGTLGGAEEITIFARPGFSADQAEITSMLEKFVMTDDQLASLEDLMFNQNKDDLPAGAQAWLDANPDFVATLK